MRRPEKNDSSVRVYDDGYLRIEPDSFYVACAGQSINLSLKEFRLISRLAQSPDRVVPYDDLWEYAWGSSDLNGGSLRVHINHLRNKVKPFGILIENMVNVGYRMSIRPQKDARRPRLA